MLVNKLKYNLFLLFAAANLASEAQTTTEENEQSVVTIIGNPITNTNQTQEYSQEHITTVNYQTQSAPPEQGKLSNSEPDVIEPTLENGMHIRFQVESTGPSSDRLGSSGYASVSGGSYGTTKAKKHNKAIAKRKFNMKKKMKSWIPKRKKKYRPNLCVDF